MLGLEGTVRRKWKVISMAEEVYITEGSRRRTLHKVEMRRSERRGSTWRIDSMTRIVESWN